MCVCRCVCGGGGGWGVGYPRGPWWYLGTYKHVDQASRVVLVVEPTCQCRRHKRHRSDPRIGKIPWRKTQQPTPVFLPGESPWTEEPGALQSMGSQSDMTEATYHAHSTHT